MLMLQSLSKMTTHFSHSQARRLQHINEVRVVTTKLRLVRCPSGDLLPVDTIEALECQRLAGGDADGEEGEADGDPQAFGVVRSVFG